MVGTQYALLAAGPYVAAASANIQSVTFIRWLGIAIVVFGLGVIILRKWRDSRDK